MSAITVADLERVRSWVGSQSNENIDDDDSVDLIWQDTERGNGDIKLTALWIWRRRLAELYERSFDFTTGGTLVNRRQRVNFVKERIAELEHLTGVADFTGRQWDVQSTEQINAEISGTELA